MRRNRQQAPTISAGVPLLQAVRPVCHRAGPGIPSRNPRRAGNPFSAPLDPRRRGTVLVFVLGVLALLALIGFALIAQTHTEHERLTVQTTASSEQAAVDGVIRTLREILRRDIWGETPPSVIAQLERPLSDDAPPGSPLNLRGFIENNEPWDAPGASDRWLASNAPYFLGPVNVQSIPTPVIEEDVLAWRHVSYLGSDITKPASDPRPELINPFMWAANSRNLADTTTIVRYGPSNLSNVRIIQTRPPLITGDLIPGSTTNVTIRAARAFWNSPVHQAQLAQNLGNSLPGVIPRFPYFDTNGDGQVDLYDATGDGIPDAPISLILETDTTDPNRPRQYYAVIHIVDHAGMADVNTASALLLPGAVVTDRNPNDLTFDDVLPGRQRRGRRATEFLLDEIAHADDWFGVNRTGEMAAHRAGGAAPDPIAYDRDILRRTLIGGRPDLQAGYNLYDLEDEASLRHRGTLVPYDRIHDRQAAGDARTIDRALPGTLLWSREITNDSYSGPPRWNRLDANYQPFGAATTYEGYTNADGVGWRTLADEDRPFAVRRHMLTTVNTQVVPPPVITDSLAPSVEDRLRLLWALGMNWPVLLPESSALFSDPNIPAADTLIDFLTVPDQRLPAEWARAQPIDINMSLPSDPFAARAEFIRYTAAALYLALDGVSNYQVFPLGNPAQATLNREYLAWQFAANLADYRDSDQVPTVIEWPNRPGRYIFGLEKQPFFTEAYANLAAATPGPGGQNLPPGTGKWFFAFELFVPPGWKIPADTLYFRAPGAAPDPGLIPLSQFIQVTNGMNLPDNILDGGPALAPGPDEHGRHYVFCGSRIHIPDDVKNSPDFQARGYTHPALAIPTDGHGRLELVYSPDGSPLNPLNHVLDVIGPSYSGGILAGGTDSGIGRWARRPEGPTAPNRHTFSLRRSNRGWRFTTAWHHYAHVQNLGGPGGGTQPPSVFEQSLGRANAPVPALSDNIPESVWPAITSLITPNGEMAGGFATGQPFEAFDSVADLSRLYMIGPLNLRQAPGLPVLFDPELINHDVPATAVLARILNTPATGDLPASAGDPHPKTNWVAAGRLDFVDARRVGDAPWTHRLFQTLTTRSHLFDGVDNDGDGVTDLDDPTEAADVLFKVAGRVNLNTAPATVLRSGPFMSFLPTSPEFVFFNPAPDPDLANMFVQSPKFFWDIAGAIVATRENRAVALRLPDAMGNLVTVARADRHPFAAQTAAARRGAFANVAELAELSKDRIIDTFNATPINDLYQADRFWSNDVDPDMALAYHRIRFGGGEPEFGIVGSPFSPDFRFNPANFTTDYMPILAPLGSIADPKEAAGIRGRDILLARWTNLYSTRSDCFTAYIALLDEDGHTVRRSQVTLDRSVCFREPTPANVRRTPILPRILYRSDGSYTDDTK